MKRFLLTPLMLCLLVPIFLLTACSSEKVTVVGGFAIWAEEQEDAEGYEIYIRGVLKNDTKQDLKNIQIKYTIYSEQADETFTYHSLTYDIAQGQQQLVSGFIVKPYDDYELIDYKILYDKEKSNLVGIVLGSVFGGLALISGITLLCIYMRRR